MQEFCKMCEPKINKLKGGYSAIVNLIFQSWLKDMRVERLKFNGKRGHAAGKRFYG